MATYNMGQWRGNPQKTKPKRIATIERTLDLTTPPYGGREELGTTAWAVGDVIELIGIRPHQIVLGVMVEVLIAGNASSRIQIGYGSDTDRWGTYKVDTAGFIDSDSDSKQGGIATPAFTPMRFTASDTIDVVLYDTVMTTGKIRISVLVSDTIHSGKGR